MKSKSARRNRRNKQRKVVHLNKMEQAPTLLGIEAPSRVFFKAIEPKPMDGNNVTAYICNRTHILASANGTHAASALVLAAQNLKNRVEEESWLAFDEDLSAEEERAIEVKQDIQAMPEPIEVGPGAFVGNNFANPAHYICPDCEAGLNEGCAGKTGGKLKGFHKNRRNLAFEGSQR